MDNFTRFWNLYPTKKAKGAAQKAFEKVEKSLGNEIEQIFLALDMQKRYRAEFQKSHPGEFMAEWKHPATWLNQQCWEDEVPSISAMKAKTDGKMCACGKPSMFGVTIALNYCQQCYMDYATEHGISQMISKSELYAAATRKGFAKRRDESMADYEARCKAFFNGSKATEYLKAHAEHLGKKNP